MTDYALAGWDAEVGEWGVEWNRYDGNPYNGEYTANIGGGDVGTIASDYVACLPGKPYRFFAWLYASAISSNDKVHVEVEWYTSAKASISSADIKTNGPLSAASTWEEYEKILQSPATACFYKVRVEVDTSAGTATVDVAGAGGAPTAIAFEAYRSSSQSCITGTTVIFDTEAHDFGSCYDHGTGVFTAPVDGLYAFTAVVRIDNFNAGNQAIVVLSVNSGSIQYYGSLSRAHANGDDQVTLASHPGMPLSAGDTVEAVITHDYGAARNVIGAQYTFFAGAKVE